MSQQTESTTKTDHTEQQLFAYTNIIEEALSWYAPIRPEELEYETEHLDRVCKELRISL